MAGVPHIPRNLRELMVFTATDEVVAHTENSLSQLTKPMRDDEVKQVVMGDELICREASLRMCALRRNRDQKTDDVYRMSQSDLK